MTDKYDSDFVRSLLESKVFDGEGKYIFISRRYAADELPEETEDLKLISSQEGKYLGSNNIGQAEFCGQHNPRTKEYDDFYVRKYHYVPLRVKHLAKLDEKKRELGLDKLLAKRDNIKYPTYKPSEEKNFPDYKSFSEAHKNKVKHYEESIDKIKKEIEPLDKEFNKFWDTLRGKYLVIDEIRIPITAENLELHINPTKKNLQKLSREDIAQWYLLETSANNLADTQKKLETALRKRRTDILKNLPNDKQIKDLIGDDVIKKGKEDLNARIKKKEALDKLYASDDEGSLSGELVKLLPIAIIFLVAVFGLVTCINNYSPPDTCKQAYEVHNDFDVYQTCKDNKKRQEILKDFE